MPSFIRFLPPLIWTAAALAVFPYFVPSAYTFTLFAVRAGAGLALLIAALVSFRLRAHPSMSTSGLAIQSAAGVVVAGLSAYVAVQGTGIITPGDGHLLSVVQSGLERQGADVASSFKDIGVASTRCEPFSMRGEWECALAISYTLAKTGERFTNEPQKKLYLSGKTGDQISEYFDANCEYDFQWSQKLRALPGYDKTMEPLEWSGCDMRNSGTHFYNRLGADRTNVVFMMSHEPGKPRTLELEQPDDRVIQAILPFRFEGKIDDVQCAPANTGSFACAVKGRQVVFRDQGIPGVMAKQELWDNFSQTVTVYRDGKRWAVK